MRLTYAEARAIEIDPRTVRRWAADGTSGGAIDALLALLERHPAELPDPERDA